MKVNCPNCKKLYNLANLDVELNDTLVCSVCNTEWSLNSNANIINDENINVNDEIKPKAKTKKRSSMLDKFLSQKKKSSNEPKGKDMKDNNSSNLNEQNDEMIKNIKSSIDNINNDVDDVDVQTEKVNKEKATKKPKGKIRNHFFDKIHEEIKNSSGKAEIEEMPYEDLKKENFQENKHHNNIKNDVIGDDFSGSDLASSDFASSDFAPSDFESPNMYGTPWDFITSEYMSTNQNRIKKSTYDTIVSLKSYINIYIEKTKIAINKFSGDAKEEKIKKLYTTLERLNRSCDNLQSTLDIDIKGNINIIQSLQHFVEITQKAIDFFEENNTTLNKDLPKKLATISVALTKAELDIKLQHDSILNGTQINVNQNMFNSNGFNMPMQFIPPQQNNYPQPYVAENSVEQIDIKKLNDEISKSIDAKLDKFINNQENAKIIANQEKSTQIEQQLLSQLSQMKDEIKSIKEQPTSESLAQTVSNVSVSSEEKVVVKTQNDDDTFDDVQTKEDLNKKFNTLIDDEAISDEFEEVYLDEYGDPIEIPEEHSIEQYYQYYENNIGEDEQKPSKFNIFIPILIVIILGLGAFTFRNELSIQFPKQMSFLSSILSFNAKKPVVFTNISYDFYMTNKKKSVDVTAILQNNSYFTKSLPNIEMHVFDQKGKLIKIINIPNNKNIEILGSEEYIISRTFHNLSLNSNSIELVIND